MLKNKNNVTIIDTRKSQTDNTKEILTIINKYI